MDKPIDLLAPRLPPKQSPQQQHQQPRQVAAQPTPSNPPAAVPELVDGKVFTVAEVNKHKFELGGKVVRIKLVETHFDAEQMSPTVAGR